MEIIIGQSSQILFFFLQKTFRQKYWRKTKKPTRCEWVESSLPPIQITEAPLAT
jgi:hypothetical protein